MFYDCLNGFSVLMTVHEYCLQTTASEGAVGRDSATCDSRELGCETARLAQTEVRVVSAQATRSHTHHCTRQCGPFHPQGTRTLLLYPITTFFFNFLGKIKHG